MERNFRRSLAAVGQMAVGGLFLVGCVPYQQYRDSLAKLEQAKSVNEDLVKKYNQVIQRLRSGAGGGDGVSRAAYEQARAEVARLREQINQTPSIPFTREDVGQITGGKFEDGGIRLGEDLLFRPGEAKLKPGQITVLDQVARLLRTKYAGESIIIEGHTDNVPLLKTRKRYTDNWNLGYQRARSVFQYLNKRMGIPEAQMVVKTYGYMKPVDEATQNTADGRRLNRRVVIRRGGFKI